MPDEHIDHAAGTGCVPGAHGEVRIENCTAYHTLTLESGVFLGLVAALREARKYLRTVEYPSAKKMIECIDAALARAEQA